MIVSLLLKKGTTSKDGSLVTLNLKSNTNLDSVPRQDFKRPLELSHKYSSKQFLSYSSTRERQRNWRNGGDDRLKYLFLYRAEDVDKNDILNYCRIRKSFIVKLKKYLILKLDICHSDLLYMKVTSRDY